MVIAIKYNEDQYYENLYYARIGGVTLEEINLLEKKLLLLIKYDVYVKEEMYESYLKEIWKNTINEVKVPMEDISSTTKSDDTSFFRQ